MKTSNILLIIALLIVLCGVVVNIYLNVVKKNNNENNMTEKKYYETTDQFSNQTYDGKTYGQTANNIIGGLIDLKKEFPQLTEISENARYNLNKSGDVFRAVFEYNNKNTGRIDWSVEMTEYKPGNLPEGKIPPTLDMVPDYAFIGKIGDMLVLFNFGTGDEEIKNSIIDILKNSGALEQNKEILLPLAQ